MLAVRLLQLGVLRLGFFQDGNVGVGVFPEAEEIFVGGEGAGAGTLGGRRSLPFHQFRYRPHRERKDDIIA